MLLIIVAYVTVSIKAFNSGGGFYVTMSVKEMFEAIILMFLCITDQFPVRVTISMTKMFQRYMFVYVTMSMTKNVSAIYVC